MKKPYYVTFQIKFPVLGGPPDNKDSIATDIEVGKFHGAQMIVDRIREKINEYLLKRYALRDSSVIITGIFKL